MAVRSDPIAVIEAPAQCCVPIAADDMSVGDAVSTAALFKALGDPHRVRVVNLLATSREAVCICDLTDFLGLAQPTVSHHMRKLVDAGLLAREQRGVWAYYSLRADAVRRLGDVVRLEPGPLGHEPHEGHEGHEGREGREGREGGEAR